MKLTATKTLNLEPIGDIHFKFDKKGRKPKGKVILVSTIQIFHMSRMSIDEETEKALMKEMKAKGSDLLTDGRDFYTTFGGAIGQIGHPQFEKELEIHEELFGKV